MCDSKKKNKIKKTGEIKRIVDLITMKLIKKQQKNVLLTTI